jgi:hypothetical protein
MNHVSPKSLAATLTLLVGGFFPAVQAATLQGYTDGSDWAAGLDVQTEQFLDGDWSDSGLSVDTTGGGPHRVYTDALGVHAAGVYDGLLEDRVSTSKDRYTVVTFKQAISAFAADWDVSLAGTGEGLKIWVNAGDGSQSIDVAVSTTGFFGFRSSGSFTELRIQGAGLGTAVAEGYSMDNARFGVAVTAVPEPATALMWAMGMGGLLVLRRRQGRSQER